VKPMADVETEVLEGQQVAKTQEMIVARASRIADAVGISNGGSLNDFAGTLRMEVATGVSRTSTIPDLPPQVVQAIFGLNVGDVTVVEDVSGAIIVELNLVAPFDPAEDNSAQVLEQVGEQQAQQVANDMMLYFGAALVTLSEPTVNQSRIDSLHLQLQ